MSFPPPTPKQARVLWFSLTALAVAVLLVLIGLFLWGVGAVMGRISGCCCRRFWPWYWLIFLTRWWNFLSGKRCRVFGRSCWCFFVLLVAGGVLGSVIPGLIKESRKLVEDLPSNVKTLSSKVENFMENSPLGRQLPSSWHLSRQPDVKPPANARTPAVLPKKIEAQSTNTNGVEVSLNIKVTDKTNNANESQTNAAQISANTESITKALNAPLSETVMPGLARGMVFITKWLTARLSEVGVWVELLVGLVLVPIYLFYFLLEKKGITQAGLIICRYVNRKQRMRWYLCYVRSTTA